MGQSLEKEFEKAIAQRDSPDRPTKFDLRNRSIIKLPDNVGLLDFILELNLFYNQMNELNPNIGGMKALKFFNCSNNRIKELPAEITELKELWELNVGVNQLTALPRGFGTFKQLKVLDLSSNKIEELPSQIGLVSTLREIYASFNKIKKKSLLNLENVLH